MVAICAHLVFRGWLALDAVLMATGGLAYSVGTVFYITKKPKLWPGIFGPHDLWHILVLIGATTDGAFDFTGYIDQFYVFDGLLTPGQVSTLFSNP